MDTRRDTRAGRPPTSDSGWDAVALHLHLVNIVRARIGQRELDRNSGYTPADVRADAEFYISTQSWARQRAVEMGLIAGER
ncbi:MAG: hypothetical protein KC431_12375 [Myxococcales bacterium]|nr:hypothetical protein [Myxococcales bacterium]